MDVFWILVVIIVLDGVLMAWLIKKLNSNNKNLFEGRDEQNSMKSWETLHAAIKKSQAMVGEAELESIKELSKSSQTLGRFEKKYEGEMESNVSAVEKELLAETAKATMRYRDGLEVLLKEMKELKGETGETLRTKTEEMLTKFGKDLSEKLTEVESKSIVAADLEVNAMKKTIAEYQKQRMEKIDSEGVEIVERAVQIVVGKGISVKEHVQLIDQALEEAKAEHFIN